MQGEPLLYYGQELGMRGITRTGTLSDSAHIPLREAMRWSADLDAAVALAAPSLSVKRSVASPAGVSLR